MRSYAVCTVDHFVQAGPSRKHYYVTKYWYYRCLRHRCTEEWINPSRVRVSLVCELVCYNVMTGRNSLSEGRRHNWSSEIPDIQQVWQTWTKYKTEESRASRSACRSGQPLGQGYSGCLIVGTINSPVTALKVALVYASLSPHTYTAKMDLYTRYVVLRNPLRTAVSFWVQLGTNYLEFESCVPKSGLKF